MTALDGAELGGVRLSVAPRTAARGELRAAGLLTDFAVGGQELAIDDLCVVPYAGPKWRGVRATQGGEVQLTFTYPGTDPAGVTIWWSDAVGTSAVWRRDDRATVTAVATNEFQVFTMRPEGWGSAYYRLEAPVR
jgi:hypothetical protein